MRNKYLFLAALFMVLNFTAMAQNENETSDDALTMFDEKPTFRFIYVAPDNNMSQQQLLAALNDHRNHIVMEKSPAIFYLVSNNNPVVVKFNMEGDNSDEFDDSFLYNLRQSMSWNVDAGFDRKNILSMLTQSDFVDKSGEFNYDNVEFDFHVGKTFWDYGNNETVIAALFFELNAAKYMDEGRMQFNVFFRCPPAKGTLNRENTFGEMNLDNINQYVIPKVDD